MKNPIAALLALILGMGVVLTAFSLDDGGDHFTSDGPIASDQIEDLLRRQLSDITEDPIDELRVPQEMLDQLERFRDEFEVPPFLTDPEFYFNDDGMGRFFFEVPPGEGRDGFGGFGFGAPPRGFRLPDAGLIDELVEMGLVNAEEAEQLRQALELLDDILQREPDNAS